MSKDSTFVRGVSARVLDFMGDDSAICQAARVSTLGDKADEVVKATTENKGLINFLMRDRHGSPFEHTAIKFFVTAPLTVWAQHDRHRIGVSKSGESGRYREMQGQFLIPEARTQTGKPGAYEMTKCDPLQPFVDGHFTRTARYCWDSYQDMLKAGIAREVARGVLPQSLMTSAYITFNVRSLMHFLSLRVDDPNNTYTTKPQKEIQDVASLYENAFMDLFPWTWEAFNKHGRAAP